MDREIDTLFIILYFIYPQEKFSSSKEETPMGMQDLCKSYTFIPVYLGLLCMFSTQLKVVSI